VVVVDEKVESRGVDGKDVTTGGEVGVGEVVNGKVRVGSGVTTGLVTGTVSKGNVEVTGVVAVGVVDVVRLVLVAGLVLVRGLVVEVVDLRL
jgi:hypothetical protein